MNSRRDFLKHLGPIVAAGSALAVSSVVEAESLNADEFVYRGWRVKWSGWQRQINQFVIAGFWAAFHPDKERGHYITTTGGSDHGYGMDELDVVEMSWNKRDGWPKPTPFELDTPEKLEAVKRRAKLALLDALK